MNYTVSLQLAAQYSGIPVSVWLRLIRNRQIPSYPAITSPVDPKAIMLLAQTIRIPVSVLPREAARQYLLDYVHKGETFHLPLIRVLEKKGPQALERIYREMSLIRTIQFLKSLHPRDSLQYIDRELQKAGISRAAYYRKEHQYMSSDSHILFEPAKVYHPKDLCYLSENYIEFCFCLPNHDYQNQILKKLAEESQRCGSGLCLRCPYHPNSPQHAKWVRQHPEAPVCNKAGQGLRYPATRYQINSFIRSIPQDVVFYGQHGPNAWESFFAVKTKRDKPQFVNDVWFGDHTMIDVMVIISKPGAPVVLARPWITMFTDAASGYPVGSVVTLRPNSQTIMEAFCRAAVFTVDSDACGLPNTIYVDNGKDYRSAMLKGIDPDSAPLPSGNFYLNKSFCDNPLLEQLRVRVLHAKPRTGRAKIIENTFGIIGSHWFRSIPGWCGDSKDTRPFDFSREKKRLLREGKLWTLEKFARYWFEFILPTYCNTAFPNNGSPIRSGDLLTPLNRYQMLPKARKTIPDWDSLAVMKERKGEYSVFEDGVHYRNEVFWHPALQHLKVPRDKPKNKVTVYDFDQTFVHSITLVYRNQFLCEAEPLVHHQIVEANRLKLELHLQEQKNERRNISSRVTMIKQSLKTAGVKANRYAEYEPETYNETESPMYAERIDDIRDQTEATTLNPEMAEYHKVVESRKKALRKIVSGPEDTPLSDFYSQLGGKMNDSDE